MYRLIFLLAIVILGCGAALSPREMCLAECDDVGRQSERDTCRIGCPGSVREHIVGVEYAGSTNARSWTCVSIIAFRPFDANGILGPVEYIRGQGVDTKKSEARIRSFLAMMDLVQSYMNANGIKSADVAPEARAFLDERQRRTDSTHRCWYYKKPIPHEVTLWPESTWPRKTTIPSPSGSMQVPAALAWDPRANPPRIIVPPIPGKRWTCRGAVYFRVRMGSDLTGVYEIVDQLSQIDGPESHAESVLRDFLIARAKAKAAEVTGDMTTFVLDTAGGALDATPIRCWQDIKRGSPSDWRGPTAW